MLGPHVSCSRRDNMYMLRSPTVAWSPGVRRMLQRLKICLEQEPSKIRRGPVIEPDSGESPRFDPWLLALRNDAYWASPDSVLPSLRALFAPPGVKRCMTGSSHGLNFVQVFEPDTDPRCFGPSTKSRASEELVNIADCNRKGLHKALQGLPRTTMQ